MGLFRQKTYGYVDGVDEAGDRPTLEERLAAMTPERRAQVLAEASAARSVVMTVAAVAFAGIIIMILITLALVAWKYWG